MSSISDYEAEQAELQARQQRSAEVSHVEPQLAPPLAAELHETHEAVANLDLGVEHQIERDPAAPPIDFGENPLIVGQQSATRLDALHAIR